MIGAFVALDLFLFYVFWELMLVPMYVMIGVWGGANRIKAALKFFLYTMVGSMLMLAAILYLAYTYAQAHRRQPTLRLLRAPARRAPAQRRRCWLLRRRSRSSFFIKVPMFPVHTWLPDAHTEAPTAGSVILAAVMLKIGTYGYLRFSHGPLPRGVAREFARDARGRRGARRHPLRRALRVEAGRREAPRRVLVGRAPRLRDARPLRGDAGVARGRRPADGQPRHLDRRALPPRRRHLRPPPHAHARRVRRPREGRCRSTRRSSSSSRWRASASRARTASSASSWSSRARSSRTSSGTSTASRPSARRSASSSARSTCSRVVQKMFFGPDHQRREQAPAGHQRARDPRGRAARRRDLRHRPLPEHLPRRRCATPSRASIADMNARIEANPAPAYYDGPDQARRRGDPKRRRPPAPPPTRRRRSGRATPADRGPTDHGARVRASRRSSSSPSARCC